MSVSENFWKKLKYEDFGFEKGLNFDAFFWPNTVKLKIFLKLTARVCYVYVEESFNTIFNMIHGGGV